MLIFSNMTPAFPRNYAVNRLPVYPESNRQGTDDATLTTVGGADSQNVSLGQFRRPILASAMNLEWMRGKQRGVHFLARRLVSTAFRFAVSRVVGRSANPQMGRVYTERDIAGMANKHSGRNRTICKFVGKAMSLYGPTPTIGKVSVSLDDITAPEPTRFGSFHLRPKPLNFVLLESRSGALARTVQSTASIISSDWNFKIGTALLAHT